MQKYIFSDNERNLYKIFITAYCLIFSIMIFLLIMGVEKASDIKSMVYGSIALFVTLVPPLIYALAHQKYRFAKFEFSNNSVSNIIKTEKRVINRNDPFKMILVKMRHGRPYGRYKEEKFIVIGRNDVVLLDSDEMSPYIAMRKYDIIILPYNREITSRLYVSLGVLVQ